MRCFCANTVSKPTTQHPAPASGMISLPETGTPGVKGKKVMLAGPSTHARTHTDCPGKPKRSHVFLPGAHWTLWTHCAGGAWGAIGGLGGAGAGVRCTLVHTPSSQFCTHVAFDGNGASDVTVAPVTVRISFGWMARGAKHAVGF